MASTAPSRYLNAKVLHTRQDGIDVTARLVVEGFLTGRRRAPYHGFAVEFASHREYTPGERYPPYQLESVVQDGSTLHQGIRGRDQPQMHDFAGCKSMRYGEVEQWSKFDHGAAAGSVYFNSSKMRLATVTFHTKIDKHFPPSTHPNHLKLMLHELGSLSSRDQTEVGMCPHLSGRIGRRGMHRVSDLFVNPQCSAMHRGHSASQP